MDRGVESTCTIHFGRLVQMLELLFGLAERAILDKELNERRVDDPGSENNLRKLQAKLIEHKTHIIAMK